MIVVVHEAEQQLREIDEWSRANRPEASTLVIDELDAARRFSRAAQTSERDFIARPFPAYAAC
jgi:hypothetical protein